MNLLEYFFILCQSRNFGQPSTRYPTEWLTCRQVAWMSPLPKAPKVVAEEVIKEASKPSSREPKGSLQQRKESTFRTYLAGLKVL